jgi:hypothetical protein
VKKNKTLGSPTNHESDGKEGVLSVELLPNLCYNYIVVEKRKRKAFGCVVRKIPICETLDYYLATCYNYIIVKMKGEHYHYEQTLICRRRNQVEGLQNVG